MPINVIIHYKGQKLVYSKANPKHWNNPVKN